MKLNWNDYYPSLGNKTIVVRGVNKDATGQPIPLTGKVKAEVVYPSSGMDLSSSVSVTPLEANFVDGRVQFSLSASSIAPPINNDVKTGLDKIEIRFNVFDDEDNDIGHIDGKWNVKNNSNTNLQEVLDGKAVFVYDNSGSPTFNNDNRRGVTGPGVTDDGYKKFNFAQELLNQVVPRKRSVTGYNLIGEDGIYYNDTETALGVFKNQFNVDNIGDVDEKNTFRKLMKDYSHQGNTSPWNNRIIDKETLVGQNQLSTDVIINVTTDGDTGLYELYDNVVRVFVDAMIEEAKNYAGIGTGTLPTDNWNARTGEGPIGTANPGEHGDGMSYCFGCKQDIEGFNNSVASCSNTPPRSTLTSFNLYTIVNGQCNGPKNYDLIDYASPSDAVLYDDPNVENDTYQGNLNDGQTGCPFTGEKNYPGLYAQEYYSLSFGNGNYYEKCNNGVGADPWPANIFPQFNTAYWSGIDCSGLVQWSVEEGKTTVGGVNITIPSPPAWRTSQGLFTEDDYNNVYYKANPADPAERLKLQNKLKKGDLVRYSGHVSIVYSEKWGESKYRNTLMTMYDIIHAYGGGSTGYYNENIPGKAPIFARKVIVTGSNIANPTGFGRIKLWE